MILSGEELKALEEKATSVIDVVEFVPLATVDREYVEKCSLPLDIRILFRTIWQVALRRGVNQPGHATMEEFSGSAPR